MARILATPRAIPANDDFQTEVVLDGSSSADPLDDPGDSRPLVFAWELTNDEVRPSPTAGSGDSDEPRWTVRFRGNRPPTIRLTVTDEDGGTGTATLQLQLTVPDP